jgi:hypothetical protein
MIFQTGLTISAPSPNLNKNIWLGLYNLINKVIYCQIHEFLLLNHHIR